MRRAARVDLNHLDIVQALRRMGASVVSMAAIGHGCPDIIIGFMGNTFLAEIKNGERDWSMTPQQETFHTTWNGSQPLVFTCVRDAELWVKRQRKPA